MTTCPCGPGWRVETARLGSGVVQKALPIISLDIQSLLNASGTGTFTIKPQDVGRLRYVWPHLTSIWASYYGEFVWGGMIETLSLDTGTLQLGCVTLDAYLAQRLLGVELNISQMSQTEIGALLVNKARVRGIPLLGAALPSNIVRDRAYPLTDHAFLGPLVEQLTQVENGPDWRLTAERTLPGKWEATMTFADKWGVDQQVTLVSDVQAPDYRMDIATDTHTTHVLAVGATDEAGNELSTTASDLPYPEGSSPYVQFDSVLSLTDVTTLNTLREQAQGYLGLNREPQANPKVTLTGRENTLGLGLEMGDTVDTRLCIGGFRYDGSARIVGDAWHASPDSPTARELMLQPQERVSQTMLDQPPCTPCTDC